MVLIGLAFGFTSCSSRSTPSPGSIPGYDEGEQYLSIWVHNIEDTEEGQCARKTVDAFNKAYQGKYFADIEFIPRNDSGGGYSDKVNASVMSRSLPDVLTVDGPNVAAYASNGIIQPLAEIPQSYLDEYLPSIIDQGTFDGKLYALGGMESSVGLYYNKDILDKAGIQVPDEDHPWTFSEFLEILEKVKPYTDEVNGYPIDMEYKVGETTIYLYSPFFWSNNGELVSEDGLYVNGIFNSENNVESVDYFKEILAEGFMSPVAITNLFESGRAAFKIDGMWEVRTIYDNFPDVKLGVAPYVVSDQWMGERYAPSGSWTYAASTEARDLEGATELVKWMSGVEAGKLLWEESKNFPSTYEANAAFGYYADDPNYSALYQQLADYGRPRPKSPAYPQISTSFQRVLENSVISDGNAQDELNKAVHKIEDKLKRYTMS